MMEINLNKVSKNYGFNNVLNEINIEITTGEKVALIGSNGCGKSSILKLITKEELPTKGEVFIRKNRSIGYLSQTPDTKLNEYSVLDILYNSFKDLNEIKNKMENLLSKVELASEEKKMDIISKYSKLEEEYLKKGGYSIDSKIEKIISVFKLDNILDNKYKSLSGGEKTIINLAILLLNNPDILLLDEPTNHLDINMLSWLENYIKNYKGTVIIVSHDRYFLDKVIDKVILIENGKNYDFYGNYSYYIKENEERILKEFKNYKDQQKKILEMKKSIKQLKEFGKKAYPCGEMFFKRAASIEKRLEKMEKLEKPILKKEIPLDLKVNNRIGKDVLIIDDINIKYGDNILIKDSKLELFYKERLCIIGNNGSGKSSLIKFLLNNKEEYFGSNVNIGYIPQEVSFDDGNITVLQESKKFIFKEEYQVRSILSKFMFNYLDVNKKINSLSGGEKIRLKLLCLMNQNKNVLILDEPTNHIDITTKEVLEEALIKYDGTILFISHDRYFINKVATKIVSIEDKKLVSYIGNYDDFISKKNHY